MTAGGGNLIGSELNRNKRSPQCGAAPIEIAERRKMSDRELCQAAYQEMYRAMIAKGIPVMCTSTKESSSTWDSAGMSLTIMARYIS